MKLSKILESILDELNVPKPEDAYKFYKIEKKDLGYGTMYRYVYENVNGDLMEISNLVTKDPKDPGKSIYIAFKKYDPNEPDEEEYDNDEEQEKKYSEKTGANDFIKVLATVVQAVRNTMNKEGGDKNIYSILFSPADKKRKNIYNHYIDTLFPDFKKDLRSSSSSFTKFINKNFKDKKAVNEIGDLSASQELNIIRDWVVDDYNVGLGYNPNTNINKLLEILKPYKKQGKIYRVISVPKDIEDVKGYIQNKISDRYASFSDFKGGIKYFLPYVTQDQNEKPVIISQVSEYYSLSDWYQNNFDKLESLYEENPDEYWWINTNLPEVSNTGECIAKTKENFEIIQF